MILFFSRVVSQSLFSLSPSSQLLLLHEHPTIEKTITQQQQRHKHQPFGES